MSDCSVAAARDAGKVFCSFLHLEMLVSFYVDVAKWPQQQ